MKKIAEDSGAQDRLVVDPRFVKRIEEARQSFQAGLGIKLEDVEE